MKKHFKQWLSIISVCSLILCIMSPFMAVAASAETQGESAFLEMSSLPDNIRFLLKDSSAELDLDSETNSALAIADKTRSIDVTQQLDSNSLQVLKTDDLNSIQIEDEKGHGQALVFGVPIRYTDEDGNTQFIDTSMTETNLFDSVFTDYDYRNAANHTEFQFSKKPDKGIRVDKAFTYAINNPDKRKLLKGYIDQTAEGNGRMVYPEAFGKNTYVEYINTSTGIKENIILEKNIGQNRFEFIFESKDYVPVLSEDKTTIQVVHHDDPNDVKYRFAALYVYDSFQPQEFDTIEEQPSREPVYVGTRQSAAAIQVVDDQESPKIKHFTTDNYYEVTKISDKKYKITSVVSMDFLNNPNTVYPVVVDPEISTNESNSAAQDTFVWEKDPNNAGNGSLSYLRFGQQNGGAIYAYHRFTQLPKLGSSPYYVNITNATLKFTFRSGQTSGANGVCLFVGDHQWTESSLTWNNQPYGEWGYTSSHNNYQYYNFYVQPFVEMWYYGGYPNYGIDFTYDTMIADYNSVVSSEGDAARAPKLTIEYSTASTAKMNTTYNRTLELGTVRWFKFVPAQTDYYNIYTTGSVDTCGYIYQGTTLKDDDDDAGASLNFLINIKLTKGTTYYIKVKGYNYEKVGSVSLRIESDFVNQLQKLHNLAKAYANNNTRSVELTMQFIRREKYKGNYMDLEFWGLAAGDIDEDFVTYVENNDPELCDFFTIAGDYYWYRPNGEVIDIPHLAATYNIYHFDTFGKVGSVVLPESWINNLGGWAGDLRSIVPVIMRNVNYSSDSNTIYTETQRLIGAAASISGFSMPDLLADVDAYNLYKSVNSSSLSSTFNTYYSSGVATRYTDFTNGWSKSQILSLTKDMLTNSVINSNKIWPFKKVDANGDKTSEALTLSTNQSNAIAEAFTDYLWAKISAE